MLREHSEVDRHSHWMDIKKKLDQDSRYKAVSDPVLREDYFYDYVKILKDERKKKKAKKSDKKEKKKKSKDKDRSSKDKTDATNEGGSVKAVSESSEVKQGADNSTPMEVDGNKSEESSPKSDSEKDEEDGEHSGTDSETERLRKDRDRKGEWRVTNC